MSSDLRAELEALVAAYDEHGGYRPTPAAVDAMFAAMKRARAVLAAPTPPADGEAEELVWRLGWIAAQCADIGWSDDSASVTRAAALLRQLPPEGLMPVEYFHADSGARIVHEPCDGEPGWCWTVSNSHVNPCTEFPTLAAAWEALQQARREESDD